MHKLVIAIDNGTSGSIGWVGTDIAPGYVLTPMFKEQSYTKAKQLISRIDHVALKKLLTGLIAETPPSDVLVVLERPCINPLRFKTSISAARALEATLCVIEDLGLPHMYCDSRDWQSKLLPHGIKGSPELKKASMDIGCRLFPTQSELITKHKDADALLIAEWARRSAL